MSLIDKLFKDESESENAVGLLVLDVIEKSGANGADIAHGLLKATVDTMVRTLGPARAAEMLRLMAEAVIEDGE